LHCFHPAASIHLRPQNCGRQLHATLKAGGVILATLPAISQIEWAGGSVAVESHGNVFAAMSFLPGL
jgi:hypothetical protein